MQKINVITVSIMIICLILQVAFASSSGALFDRHRYRNFFRTIIAQRFIGTALAQLMVEFGWKQMGLITQDVALFQNVSL